MVPNPLSWAIKSLFVTAFTSTDKAKRLIESKDSFDVAAADGEPRALVALLAIFVVLFLAGLAATHVRLNMLDEASSSSPASKARDGRGEAPARSGASLALAEKRTPLLAAKSFGALEDTPYGAIDDVPSVQISVEDVSVTRRDGSKVLREVRAFFGAGSSTALMGPSGAGKTTMLETVSGRVDADVRGKILVNGKPLDPVAFRLLATFTPQRDDLLPELTVRETLHYTAELRCRYDLSAHEKYQRAEEVLEQLRLSAVGDVVVGGRGTTGVSGGQLKRTSIGMDLLADRPVMILDEPTTGLDAYAAGWEPLG